MYQTKRIPNLSPVAITLVKTLNDLATRYNNGEPGINFFDIRNLEQYISDEGINLNEVNDYLGV